MFVDKDGWIHPEDADEPSTLAENNPDDVDWDATNEYRKVQESKYRKEQEKIEMVKSNDDGEKVACGTQQVYISVEGACLPTIAIRPADVKSHPANMVRLEGAVVELSGSRGEKSAWDIAQRISDLCRLGHEAESEMGNRNSMCEHLAYAYSILVDYVKEFDGDFTISKETSETLIRGAIDRIVSAGKCIGFDLDKYRTEE